MPHRIPRIIEKLAALDREYRNLSHKVDTLEGHVMAIDAKLNMRHAELLSSMKQVELYMLEQKAQLKTLQWVGACAGAFIGIAAGLARLFIH